MGVDYDSGKEALYFFDRPLINAWCFNFNQTDWLMK